MTDGDLQNEACWAREALSSGSVPPEQLFSYLCAASARLHLLEAAEPSKLDADDIEFMRGLRSVLDAVVAAGRRHRRFKTALTIRPIGSGHSRSDVRQASARRAEIALHVEGRLADGWKVEAALKDAEHRFKVGKSTVKKAVSEQRKFGELPELLDRAQKADAKAT